LEHLAIPAVSILIIFLAYTSQYLFHYIEPGPLSRREATWFNIFLLAIWWSYYNACTVDPGPKGWVNATNKKDEKVQELGSGVRWCKKCDNIKPPRAHHCKKCQR
jgi:palmitoyltransferase